MNTGRRADVRRGLKSIGYRAGYIIISDLHQPVGTGDFLLSTSPVAVSLPPGVGVEEPSAWSRAPSAASEDEGRSGDMDLDLLALLPPARPSAGAFCSASLARAARAAVRSALTWLMIAPGFQPPLPTPARPSKPLPGGLFSSCELMSLPDPVKTDRDSRVHCQWGYVSEKL